MSGETIAILVSVGGFLLTLGGVCIALGKRDARLDALEERVKEDREKNSAQHESFYATDKTVGRIDERMKSLSEDMGEVKGNIEKILERLPARTA